MNPIEPTAPLSITLQAQEWNQIIALLGKAPYETVAHLIGKIGEQAQASAAAASPLVNGSAAHVPN